MILLIITVKQCDISNNQLDIQGKQLNSSNEQSSILTSQRILIRQQKEIVSKQSELIQQNNKIAYQQELLAKKLLELSQSTAFTNIMPDADCILKLGKKPGEISYYVINNSLINIVSVSVDHYIIVLDKNNKTKLIYGSAYPLHNFFSPKMVLKEINKSDKMVDNIQDMRMFWDTPSYTDLNLYLYVFILEYYRETDRKKFSKIIVYSLNKHDDKPKRIKNLSSYPYLKEIEFSLQNQKEGRLRLPGIEDYLLP